MKVSVIIPVYNVKPYLERCVQSVLGQTYKDIEMILVDDGSTDGSGQLCDELAAKHGQIRVIHQENQGLSVARNVGIQQAIGEYVVFLNSDDEWLLNDGLQQVVNKVEEDTDLIIFKCVHFYNNGSKISIKNYDIENIEKLRTAGQVFDYLVRTQQFKMSACFLMIRRKLLMDYGVFFPVGLFSEDVYWSMHLWQYVQKVRIINLDFYCYRHRLLTLSTTADVRVYESYDRIFTYWEQQCDRNCINSTAIRFYLANMWVSIGCSYYKLNTCDKPSALSVLKKHKGLLKYSVTPKAKNVSILVNTIGVKNTVILLGIYWRLRSIVRGNAV